MRSSPSPSRTPRAASRRYRDASSSRSGGSSDYRRRTVRLSSGEPVDAITSTSTGGLQRRDGGARHPASPDTQLGRRSQPAQRTHRTWAAHPAVLVVLGPAPARARGSARHPGPTPGRLAILRHLRAVGRGPLDDGCSPEHPGRSRTPADEQILDGFMAADNSQRNDGHRPGRAHSASSVACPSRPGKVISGQGAWVEQRRGGRHRDAARYAERATHGPVMPCSHARSSLCSRNGRA